MALADTAMVFAVAGASGGFRPMTTVGQTISFLRPIAGADAIATARLLRLGKTLAFGEVHICAHDRDDVAGQVSSTYAILGPAPTP
jgi:acyl-coenzyme A thioesterase PaaI-like protein